MKKSIIIVLSAALFCLSSANVYSQFKKKSNEEKREIIREDSEEILVKLYKEYPHAKKKIKSAVGYGTFDNKNINLFLLSSADGKGIVIDNRNGEETFMAMRSVGGGVGLGVRDLSVIFIFNDEAVMDRFVEDGWQFGGESNATAKMADEGEEIVLDGAMDSGVEVMEIYTITDTGVALQATVSGTKYWQLKKLNE